MIHTVLWDVDGTLLDFDAAERAAIRAMFSEFGLGECADAMLARYSEINIGFWQRLEGLNSFSANTESVRILFRNSMRSISWPWGIRLFTVMTA